MARYRPVKVAQVKLWGFDVGAVAWNEERRIGEFEYEPSFIRQNLNIAPLTVPLRSGIFSFPALNHETFHGLPGLLADSLPDRYGNRLIDLWLARQGRSRNDFSPVERLCYIGTRGMGAMEFFPVIGPKNAKAGTLDVEELARLAADILQHRSKLAVRVGTKHNKAVEMIFRVGTSAAGNRAKALIAWNPKTREIRSGQVKAPPGFQLWILKFDGVNEKSLGDPKGFGRVEYAYYKMAVRAGIEMKESRLLEENERAHFMTRRFDRDNDGNKIHMQSLCALSHYDFNAAGEYGYEQAFSAIQQMNLGHETMEQMYRRMVFNVLARNQDDHTRNIAFLMDHSGKWRLAPAFDVVWSYNPRGQWTNQHQMSLNMKRDGFKKEDLLVIARKFGIKKPNDIFGEIHEAVGQWTRYASEVGVETDLSKEIARTHRLNLE